MTSQDTVVNEIQRHRTVFYLLSKLFETELFNKPNTEVIEKHYFINGDYIGDYEVYAFDFKADISDFNEWICWCMKYGMYPAIDKIFEYKWSRIIDNEIVVMGITGAELKQYYHTKIELYVTRLWG